MQYKIVVNCLLRMGEEQTWHNPQRVHMGRLQLNLANLKMNKIIMCILFDVWVLTSAFFERRKSSIGIRLTLGRLLVLSDY